MSEPSSTATLQRCLEIARKAADANANSPAYDPALADSLMDLRVELSGCLSAHSETRETFSPLERFALTILEDMREHPGDDMDGDTLFDAAEISGLLHEVKVEEPCSEHYCTCAEVSDFPLECMRETDYLRGKLAKFRKEKANG